jgi:hypothetical protein
LVVVEASYINYHCQENDPPSVWKFSDWQIQFEAQHMAILQEINEKVMPQPEQSLSSSDEDDSDQDKKLSISTISELVPRSIPKRITSFKKSTLLTLFVLTAAELFLFSWEVFISQAIIVSKPFS